MKKTLLTLIIAILITNLYGQQDLVIGSSYQLSLQRQNIHGDAWILHNAEFSQDVDLLKWKNTHSSYGSRGIRFTYSSGGGIFFYADNTSTSAGSVFNPTTRLFIGNNGNIGIGTTSPASKLVIDHSIVGAASNTFTTTASNAVLALSASSITGTKLLSGIGASTYAWMQVQNANNTLYNLVLNPMGGNVGIGTTSPASKLDIDHSIVGAASNAFTTTASNAVLALSVSSITNTKLLSGISSAECAWIQVQNANNTLYNLALNPMGGNVGIGTNCPRYTLDVLGTIRAKEVKVDLQGGCDFVFKSDYKLMNLKELESFVKTNQHLPDIASEKEMVENGVNMKELQMKLLQKMEEMTLYMIEQNKKIEIIEEQNKLLKQEIELLKTK